MSEYGLEHPDKVWEFTPSQARILAGAILKRKRKELTQMATVLRLAAWAKDNQFQEFVGDSENTEESTTKIPGIQYR